MTNQSQSQNAQFWLLIGTQPTGPFDPEQIQGKLASGEITYETMAAAVGSKTWCPLLNIPELMQVPNSRLVPVPNSSDPTPKTPISPSIAPPISAPESNAEPALPGPKPTLKIKDRLVTEFRNIASLTFYQTLRFIGSVQSRLKGKAISPESTSKEPLFPASITDKLRVVFGYGIAVIVLWLGINITSMLFGSGKTITNIKQEKELGEAIGFVVCGDRVIGPDGKLKENPTESGSCFAVSADGYLLTNKHVVETTHNNQQAKHVLDKLREKDGLDVKPTVWVFFGKDKFIAEIIYISDDFDLAILKVSRNQSHFFELSNSDQMTRSTRVYACGFPGASRITLSEKERLSQLVSEKLSTGKKVEEKFKPRDFEFGMTSGTVSKVAVEDALKTTTKWIQHDASINPGNSGGPLLDEGGKVIGINTLGIKGAAGTFYSLSMPQLRKEIGQHIRNANWR